MYKEFNIIYYFCILNKWRVKISVFIILGVIVGILKSFTAPVLYSSAATALLPLEQNSRLEFTSLFNRTAFSRDTLTANTAISIISSRRMREAIIKHFNLAGKPRFKMRIIAYRGESYIVVGVNGTDPQLTKDITDFCVRNVDKIGAELNIAIEKPMLIMLDPADYGVPISNDIVKGMIVGGLFAVICSLLFIFFTEYAFFYARKI